MDLKAAEQGLPRAQYFIGRMYWEGVGIAKDHAAAASWYKKAAEQGYDSAQNNLANMYLEGDTVPKDLKKAFELYQQAAEQGHVRAVASLATLYMNGTGIQQDHVSAYMWFLLCEKAGVSGIQDALKLVRSKLSAVQIAEGEERATRWLATHKLQELK